MIAKTTRDLVSTTEWVDTPHRCANVTCEAGAARYPTAAMNMPLVAIILSCAATACATGVADSTDPAGPPANPASGDAGDALDAQIGTERDATKTGEQDVGAPEIDSAAPPEDSGVPVDVGAPLEASTPFDASPTPNDAGSTTCSSTLASPTTVASCTACLTGSHTCQSNGCYNGYWCNTSTDKCNAPPANCP